jgi:hypothetical protein
MRKHVWVIESKVLFVPDEWHPTQFCEPTRKRARAKIKDIRGRLPGYVQPEIRHRVRKYVVGHLR